MIFAFINWYEITCRTILRAIRQPHKSDTVELGILIERHNMRGAFSKGMYEGGNQERAFGAQAAEWAKAATKWPRAHSMLLEISRSWHEDAKREDERARQDEVKFEQ